MRRPDASLAAGITGLAAAALQLGPVLGHGYVLLRDMVFTPHIPLDAAVLGVTGVPRAVPSDLLVALLSRAVPADVLEDLLLVAIVAVGAWGAGRLLRPSRVGAVAAAALYGWNPYLTERLLLGQWAVLLGYLSLPWVAAAARDLREGVAGANRRVLLWAAVAAAGGASAELLALLVALPVLAWPGGQRRGRRVAAAAAGFAVLALPWAVPALTQPAGAVPDRVGAVVFAARPDTHLGAVGSLLTLGGVWNAGAVPPGRSLLVVSLLALAVTATAGWGLVRLARAGQGATFRGLALAGLLGLLIALWGVTPGARAGLLWLAERSQAVDLLRDGQRYLAPFVLVVAVGWGRAVLDLYRCRRRAAALAAVPPLLLPAAGWGIDGALAGVTWPGAWAAAAAATDRLPAGPVLVLPWGLERSFPWNADRPLTEPAPLWLSRRTVSDTRAFVGARHTPQEDPLARRIGPAVLGTGPLVEVLRRQGYAGVLVERDQPGGRAAAQRLAGAHPIVVTPSLGLFAIPRPAAGAVAEAPVPLALTGDGLAGFVIALSGAGAIVSRRNQRRQM